MGIYRRFNRTGERHTKGSESEEGGGGGGGGGGVERPCHFRHSRVLMQLASPATRNGTACWQAAEVVARENTLQRHPEMACRKMLVVFSSL